jgi:hypothetical protein
MQTCPNCAAELTPDYTYCPQCGQKAHLHRFSWHEISHEAVHAVTHADKGVFKLIKDLAIRPGVVAREYVLEGKRKRHFNPFTFLTLVLGLALTVNALVHPYTQTRPIPSPTRTGVTIRGAAGNEFLQRRLALSGFIEKRTNLVLLVSIPVFAAVFWLVFRRTRLHYAEFLVAQVLFSGFFSLVTTLIFTPLARYLPGGVYNLLQLLFQLAYLALAYRQFFTGHRPQSLLRTTSATLLAIVVWVMVSGGAGYLYIRYGG